MPDKEPTYLPIVPTRDISKGCVERFLDTAKDENGNILASQIGSSGIKLAKTIVMIPVAAHQDGHRIVPAMEQYARQQTDETFTVALHLNHPENIIDRQRSKKAYEEVERAKSLYPNLDIRVCNMEYDTPKIGKIRADLWRSVVTLAYHEEQLRPNTPEILGINHDIDVDYIHPSYIDRVQKHYRSIETRRQTHQMLPVATTMVSHSLPHETHPNSTRIIGWSDLAHRQNSDISGYEAGVLCPLKTYTARGGFNENDETYETQRLAGYHLYGSIAGTYLRTSPRRYIDRLHDDNPANIWREGTFTHTDPCRNNRWHPDITSKRADKMLYESVPGHIKDYYVAAAERVALKQYIRLQIATRGQVDNDTALNILERHMAYEMNLRLQLAKRALRSIAKLPYSEGYLNGYDPAQLARHKVNKLRFKINEETNNES